MKKCLLAIVIFVLIPFFPIVASQESYSMLAGVDSSYKDFDNDPYNSGYYKKEGVVYFYNHESMESLDADVNTFNVFGDGAMNIYARDKDKVFLGSKIIKGADPLTFGRLSYGYAADKNRVYYANTVLTGADPKTFRQVSADYSIDKNRAYFLLFNSDEPKIVFINGADYETFEVIPATILDRNDDPYGSPVLIHGPCGGAVGAKDKKHVYCNGKVYMGKSFLTLGSYLFLVSFVLIFSIGFFVLVVKLVFKKNVRRKLIEKKQ